MIYKVYRLLVICKCREVGLSRGVLSVGEFVLAEKETVKSLVPVIGYLLKSYNIGSISVYYRRYGEISAFHRSLLVPKLAKNVKRHYTRVGTFGTIGTVDKIVTVGISDQRLYYINVSIHKQSVRIQLRGISLHESIHDRSSHIVSSASDK